MPSLYKAVCPIAANQEVELALSQFHTAEAPFFLLNPPA